MARAYLEEGLTGSAVFQLFYRDLPGNRNYIVAYGVEDALDAVEHLAFSDDDLDYLATLPAFPQSFLDVLADLRFTGSVRAVRDGTIIFPNEPIIEIEAPIVEAQILETIVLNRSHVGSVLASKAARVVSAAAGRNVVDFGSRRAHGTDAALMAARAGYVAGVAGTSNVLAGRLHGIPVVGTMAHSYVQAHDKETEALRRFAEIYPGTTLLVDTYDTLHGVREVVRLARRMGSDFTVGAVRIDSGDLIALSKETRRILDEGGLRDVSILVSGGLDEYAIRTILDAGAPVDGFGVGTKMVVSKDAPDLDLAYKLVLYQDAPRIKTSPGKPIYPGRKQVLRRIENGRMVGDRIVPAGSDTDGESLLSTVMRDGRRVGDASAGIEAARLHCREQLSLLPPELLALETAMLPYPVELSGSIRSARRALTDELP
ncbi:MAG: nicotinate phosphoribosyltransferase [Candidatus Eisenbacteria bacterium]|nr:nicotinate phosphoribosyltransferase [Candidatus Eisenbacteria bacterium]